MIRRKGGGGVVGAATALGVWNPHTLTHLVARFVASVLRPIKKGGRVTT